jgi:ornithine cyclodeaminase
MSVLAIDAATLRASLRFEHLIEPMAQAFREASSGSADNGLIVMFPAARRDDGDVYVKTGTLVGHRLFVVKVAPWFRKNVERGWPQGGLVAAFDASNGRLLALFDDEHYLSDIRTAAAGAVAARALAPPTIDTVAVLGAGSQAYLQSLALHSVRPFRTLIVWARQPERAEWLARRIQVALPGVEVRVRADIEPSVRSAHVLITATPSRDALVRGEWLRPGVHVTAVGADDPTKCELDADCLRTSRVFVDCRATAAANGDVHRAVRDGTYRLEQLAGELGEVLLGRVVGRRGPDDMTVAKLVGIGAQDVVAVEEVLQRLGVSSVEFTGPGKKSAG